MASQNNTSPPLCATGCGFFGSLETKQMCSKCFADHLMQEEMNQVIAQAIKVCEVLNNSATTPTPPPPPPPPRNRCLCCKKKVGLLGFACKCGAVFCGEHRYPEKHSCSVDFKTAGREVLANQNPVCKADKMESRI